MAIVGAAIRTFIDAQRVGRLATVDERARPHVVPVCFALEGDTLYMTESPDGYRLTPYDPAFARQMKAAAKGMRRYRNALRELAR